MTDILILDNSDAFVDIIEGASLPLSDQSASALGLTLGDTYKFYALGGEVTGVISSVPDAFVDADWSVATGSGSQQLNITLTDLPESNGAEITDVEYDVEASGSWIPLGGTSGVFGVTMAAGSTEYDIRLRAVNENGEGPAGNTETATSSASSAFFIEQSWRMDGNEAAHIVGGQLATTNQTFGYAVFTYDDYMDGEDDCLMQTGPGAAGLRFNNGVLSFKVNSGVEFTSTRTFTDGVKYAIALSLTADGSGTDCQIATIEDGEEEWTLEEDSSANPTNLMNLSTGNDLGIGCRGDFPPSSTAWTYWRGTLNGLVWFTGYAPDLSVGLTDNTGVFQYVLDSMESMTLADPADMITEAGVSPAINLTTEVSDQPENTGTLGAFTAISGGWPAA